jgi:Subtilase family
MNWAVKECKVDIITMSFGFPSPIESISEAIKLAAFADIIMFAAASNDGGNSGRAFPASDSNVICIHSTDGKGNKSSFSPTHHETSLNFSVLGENVKSSWPMNADGICKKRKSGTSFATPIAVAIAANLLEYTRQKMSTMPKNLHARLRSGDGMRRVFTLMVRRKRDGYDYVTPEYLFGKGRTDRYIYETIQNALTIMWT